MAHSNLHEIHKRRRFVSIDPFDEGSEDLVHINLVSVGLRREKVEQSLDFKFVQRDLDFQMSIFVGFELKFVHQVAGKPSQENIWLGWSLLDKIL